MREIKYKFWLGHTKKMTYEHSLHELLGKNWYMTIDVIPLEFTGFKDVNNDETYDGYIIEHNRELRIVFWNDEMGGWFTRCKKDNVEFGFSWINNHGGYKNVGNIYENPELIESWQISQK